MVEDAELLRRYVDEGSQDAFAELVRRHLGPVYSGALRRTHDAQLAADVAQVVFVRLAQHARTLRSHPALAAWLFTATRNAAINAVVAEQRRRKREQEAYPMHDSASESPVATVDADRLRPLLYEALDRLSDTDRTAVLLRYIERRTFGEIAAVLRVGEEAARKRVGRALEKLQAAFARRGLTSSAAAVATVLTAEASTGVPVAVATAVLASAGATLPIATTTAWLASLFTMSKLTTGIAVAVVATGLVVTLGEIRANRSLRSELADLHSVGSDRTAIERENVQLNARLRELSARDPRVLELQRLERRAAVLAARPPGVDEALFRPAGSWRNVGRDTIENANETLHWAMFHDDLDAAAQFIVFSNDTPENRAAFLAQCSAAIRARYQTPEKIVAAALFGLDGTASHSPDEAIQVLGEDDHVGGDGSRFGQKHLRVWYHSSDGREFEGGSRWLQTSQGWAQAPLSLGATAKPSDSALTVLRWFDPTTGNRLPIKAIAAAPAKSP